MGDGVGVKEGGHAGVGWGWGATESAHSPSSELQRVAIREEQEIRDDAAIAAEVDLSEMVGDYSDDEGETSGMQIASPEELEPSGFEDVDLSEMQSED